MAKIFSVHPVAPQTRTIAQICDQLRRGALMLYPTDTVPAIGCDLESKRAIERVRQLKRLSNDKPLTFLCSSLSNLADYAIVSDAAYRFMKRLIPGPYTFVLPATKLVPKLVQDPKRRTTGIRVPDLPICQALIEHLGHPIISTSANLPDPGESSAWDEMDAHPYNSAADWFDRFDPLVDLAIDDGQLFDRPLPTAVSTIIDLTGSEAEILRAGQGVEAALAWLG